MPSESVTDLDDRYEVCPKCGEPFNHWIPNGYRNSWPTDVDFEICTTDETERVYVHTQNLKHDWSHDLAGSEGDDAE